ncbi:oligosaccharide flippase family protein [Arthrobacter sp. SO3]|uniref:oligosaccharide flippase family protein n=1 Tax=Arthrobacter sp. SO3 TaxID=1897057 RepID=UPI001CFFE086|nr:oligosaccharide flippase family protein [Arthrobacter sp. SO3]MCB5291205.1 hypothetical protein [Arthrobacter sp. SO3]
MSRFRNAARGASWTLGCQLVTSIGQFVYSGITARIFSPAEFGGFAVALSLMGILTLLTTTGLPAFVLREPTLSHEQVLRLRLLAFVGGALSSFLFCAIAPSWLALLNAPEGSSYIPMLAVAQALGPISAVESALLRRELKPKFDAFSLLLSFILSTICALLLAFLVRQNWVLALAVAMQPFLLTIFARILQKDRRQHGSSLDLAAVLGFTRRITAQNVSFFLLQKFPEWTVSASLGAGALGQFSKGGALTQMPASALSAALNRAIQPHWRFISDRNVADRAAKDATILAAGVAFPIFAIVAANAGAIVDLWLGPGWEPAGALATLIAIGGGLTVPFGIMTNGFEMRGNFRPVRFAQWAMFISLLPPIAMLIATGDLVWSAVAFAFAQLTGLVIVAIWPTTARTRLSLLKKLCVLAMWSTLVSVAGFIAGLEASYFMTSDEALRDFIQVLVGGSISAVLWLITFRWHETNRIFQRRGLRIPWVIGGKNTRRPVS